MPQHEDLAATPGPAESQAVQSLGAEPDLSSFGAGSPSAATLLSLQRLAGNASVGAMLHVQRSPLSDELKQLWQTGKGPFFDKMRTLTVQDPDVRQFITSQLAGDDQWLALNLIEFG